MESNQNHPMQSNTPNNRITTDEVIAQNNRRIAELNNRRISEQSKKQLSKKKNSKTSPHKKISTTRNKVRFGILVFRLISLVIIIVCARVLINWHKENKINNEVIADLQNDTNIERDSIDVYSIEEHEDGDDHRDSNEDDDSDDSIQLVSTDFEDLLSQNKDTIGWIYIANTNINFPIVKTSNNSYYLKRNFRKEYNSAGWIFADYRNNFDELDQNTIVYGHNRRNGTMFSNLKKFLDASFAGKMSSKYFSFNTINQRYVAKVYSVYKMSSTKLTLANNFESSEEYEKFINDVKTLSTHEYDTEVSSSDKTLTLCTCDDNTAYRIVIHAKLIPIE